jgi:hypothetical protein
MGAGDPADCIIRTSLGTRRTARSPPISLAQQGNWVLVEPIKQRRIHISTILGRKTSLHSP